MPHLEVCANNYTSAFAAQNGGANRVEFCENLADGGTTPSYGQIALAKKNLTIKIYPIIRPRGGNFLYSEEEFEIMKTDIEQFKNLGCDGIVFGILTADGHIDTARCRELLERAAPLPATFHRAFDVCADPMQALEDIIRLGFERILTSGQKPTAIEGIDLIKSLVKKAAGRIAIMAGSGVNEQNVQQLIRETGVQEVHSTAKAVVPGGMQFHHPDVSFSAHPREGVEYSDENRVRKLVELISP
ncbi:MAG: copper homeostasis protein CutC [Mucilaginibacter polytrichastri]|nr:copper homeostasis protein CutC [Mucilaginibacter polytrichastri]